MDCVSCGEDEAMHENKWCARCWARLVAMAYMESGGSPPRRPMNWLDEIEQRTKSKQPGQWTTGDVDKLVRALKIALHDLEKFCSCCEVRGVHSHGCSLSLAARIRKGDF